MEILKLVLGTIFICTALSDIQSVQLLCRHGARSPMIEYPNYKHKNHWKNGAGVLTTVGMRECYDAGIFFRTFYHDLISNTSFPQSVEAYSAEKDRVLQSAEALLAGLYPPIYEKAVAVDLLWRPIPVRVFSVESDYYLQGVDIDKCPALAKEYTEIYFSEIVKDFVNQEKAFIEKMCTLAGYRKFDYLDMFVCVFALTDCFNCDKAANLSRPTWISSEEESHLQRIKGSFLTILNKDFPEYSYLSSGGGPLLGKIVNNLNNFSASAEKHFVLFHAHDITIASFLGNLNFTIYYDPPFASCVAVELHSENQEFYVEMRYHNSTDSPAPLTLQGCSQQCPLKQFLSLTSNRVNLHPEEECLLP